MAIELGNYLTTHIKRWLLRTTVGLYTRDWLGVPRVIGSAVCLECASGFSLLTAAHVLASTPKRGLYLRPGQKDDALISLNHCRAAAMHEEGRELDLAMILLNSDITDRMHSETYWLSAKDILDDEESLEDQLLLVFGYPVERFALNPIRHELVSRALLYVTTLYEGERGPWDEDETYTAQYAVDLDFSPQSPVGTVGQKVKQPTPKGLSGGGIWILAESRESPVPIVLVGIQHRWHKILQSLRGTRIVGLTGEITPVQRKANN